MMLKVRIDGRFKEINAEAMRKFVDHDGELVIDDIVIGINSGMRFKTQYVFIDIDGISQDDAIILANEIIDKEKFRRAIVVKSNSENHFHIISFSPVPYRRMIEILANPSYKDDVRHLAKAQDNGFATLRFSGKNGFVPQPAQIVNNIPNEDEQLNFYDFDQEKAYLKLLENERNATHD